MIVIVIIIGEHHYSHMTLAQSTETAHHSVQARMCALQSWRLDLLACNKGKWTANKGITTLKRPANLFPSPNIPPRHLPDCLGHTWLQNKPTPIPRCTFHLLKCCHWQIQYIVTGRYNISFFPTQGCKMPIMNHAHCPNIS